MSSRTADLIAFVAVLGASVEFTAMGVSPDQTAVLASAATMLYTAWRRTGEEARDSQTAAALDESDAAEERSTPSTRH